MAIVFIALAVALSVGMGAVVAAGKLVVHVNKGIGTAALGMTQASAMKAIGSKASKSGKDSEYEGRVVYFVYYGKANANGEYPLEMYSDTKKKVFLFEVNSAAYPTDAGIKIGSKEADLKKAYGKKLTCKKGRLYTNYTLGGKTGTDFFVKKGLVTQILVRSY
jgi:hypothetical protein